MKKGRKAFGSKPPASAAPGAATSAATALPAPAPLPTAPVATEFQNLQYMTPGTAVVVEDAKGKSLGNVRKLKEAGTLAIRTKDGTVYSMPVSAVTTIWAIPREEFLKIPGATEAAHERAVALAYAAGQPVPANVLIDYPELKKLPAPPVLERITPGLRLPPAEHIHQTNLALLKRFKAEGKIKEIPTVEDIANPSRLITRRTKPVANHPDSCLTQETDRRQGDRRPDAVTASDLQVEGELKSWQEGVWQGSPVTYYEGPIDELKRRVPGFARQTYSVDGPGYYRCINSRYDSIIRIPLVPGEHPISVGIVSKSYRLLPHRALIQIALESIRAAKVDEPEVRAEIGLTEFGERMILRLYFPKSYDFDPGDGHPIGLRLECFNSVDGSCRLVAMLGWIRFICSNGVFLGKIKFNFRKIHNVYLKKEEMSSVLTNGLKTIEAEKECLRRWYQTVVDPRRVVAWIDGEVRVAWGVKAAARALHITRTGQDAVLTRPFEKGLPSERTVQGAQAVPGAHASAENLFHVSQALFWLAKERRELEERLEWEVQAYALLKKLRARRKVPRTQ